ncbi:C40 family peptidase [Thermocatellispora tengchongensis]|uniref:C40 family peptidase n=1 Tax=Thermocatellispora tengchongensis TaxID=1073253 RepID=UPI00362F6122
MLMSTFPSFLGGGTLPDCEEVAPGGGDDLSATAGSDIPAEYLELYQKYGKEIGVQWNVLAAVGKRETNHGRSTLPGVRSGTNSAGAAGPMQFLISTWGGKAKIDIPSKFNGYASDGDGDGVADVYNPADAILGAAKMLKRNGAPEDVRRALFVYNRAWWYVDQVLEIAQRYAKDGELTLPPEADPACDEPLVEAAPNDIVKEILDYALAQRGKPYRWGGTGPDAFDCSGIIYMAYRSVGLSIPVRRSASGPSESGSTKATNNPATWCSSTPAPAPAPTAPGTSAWWSPRARWSRRAAACAGRSR